MAKQAQHLHGQVAAITGAARGIGRATAEAFLREGMKVAIGDLDLELAQRTAADLGAGTIALKLDVAADGSFDSFLDATEEQLGPLDVLVNNAGIMTVGRFVDESDEAAARMVDINLHGVILGMKSGLRRMLPRNRGHIVNIASQAGKYGQAGGATYSATKHAVIGLTEAVRGELALDDARVRLSYVMPYVVNTELGGGAAQPRGFKNLEPHEVADAIVDALRFGTVEVWVPKSAKAMNRAFSVLPRSASEGFVRALKADRVLAHADMGARRDYELRAARSEPGLEPGTDPTQLTE